MAVTLEQYGWDGGFADVWERIGADGLMPARVVADFGTSLQIVTPETVKAELSGKLAHYTDREFSPKVGDWVAARLHSDGTAVIEAVLPRRSEIARKSAGKRVGKQIIAANIDVAFVLLALDNDFSLERLQRFLYQLSVSHVRAVIVLNKADKTDDVGSYLGRIESLGLPVIVCSVVNGVGVPEIMAHIGTGQTAILLGSSGVGKSTLTNQLLQREMQATQAVRASDDTGRHTTVHRQLFMLPDGGMLIDSPGVREMQLWGTQEDLDEDVDFSDIVELAAQCKYATCRHDKEPGCAVRAALQNGALPAAHYDDYLKLKAELTVLQRKRTVQAGYANKRSRKSLDRRAKDIMNDD